MTEAVEGQRDMDENAKIRVVELFAGVGGFRLGLERCSARFETVWANQWEPNKKTQYAFDCYVSHFGASENHVCADIGMVKNLVPEHDLLVGGFPCQDYSVARTSAKGIEGKKGVLWWDINDIVKERLPPYIFLENVDRLLRSPAAQRGRDFGIILRCLNDCGYAVEWRVINAADYGAAQRRRRTYIFAYRDNTQLYRLLENALSQNKGNPYSAWLTEVGFFAKAFPVTQEHHAAKRFRCNLGNAQYADLADISARFFADFFNAGVMQNGVVFSEELTPNGSAPKTIADIQQNTSADKKYCLAATEKFAYLKGRKCIKRRRPNGEPYFFKEGAIPFPDDLDKPARTMLTSEGTTNRSTHVITDKETGKLRLLTPVECERLNGFPDNWTNTGMPERFRYFTMGNALVVPMITKMGERILEIL